MGIADWIRVIDTVTGLAQMSGKLRPRGNGPGVPAAQDASPGMLETRLAGVVVAALKEAFDRDRARMDLERAQIEAERRRAEEALAAELRRQASERALGQLRLIAVMAIAAWMLSAALAAWLPGMRAGVPRGLLAAGWALAFVTLGCGFAGWQQISAWTADTGSAQSGAPRSAAASATPWTLLAALGAIGASLLIAL
jgi:hypothetical protein